MSGWVRCHPVWLPLMSACADTRSSWRWTGRSAASSRRHDRGKRGRTTASVPTRGSMRSPMWTPTKGCGGWHGSSGRWGCRRRWLRSRLKDLRGSCPRTAAPPRSGSTSPGGSSPGRRRSYVGSSMRGRSWPVSSGASPSVGCMRGWARRAATRPQIPGRAATWLGMLCPCSSTTTPERRNSC